MELHIDYRLDELFDGYFKSCSLSYQLDDDGLCARLLGVGVLINDSSDIKLNVQSVILQELLSNYIVRCTHRNYPYDVVEAFKFIEEFEKNKKKENGYHNYINAYSQLLDCHKSYVAWKSSRDLKDLSCFFMELSKEYLLRYSEVLLGMSQFGNHVDIVAFSALLHRLEEHEIIHSFRKYFNDLALKDIEHLWNFYRYEYSRPNNFYIKSNILIVLSLYDFQKVYDELCKLKDDGELVAFILGRLHYSRLSEVDSMMLLCDDLLEGSSAGTKTQLAYAYTKFIEHPNSNDDVKEACWGKLRELFIHDGESLRDAIFRFVCYINGFEQNRFTFFVEIILGNDSRYFGKINEFFHWFKNPEYFFDLLRKLSVLSLKNGHPFLVMKYRSSLEHFLSEGKEETWKCICNSLYDNFPHFRIQIAEMLLWIDDNCSVDLNLFETEIQQLRALEAISFVLHCSIEKMLPLLLTFKTSKYPSVRTFLQRNLSQLILTSYGVTLYDKLEELMGEDDDFMVDIRVTKEHVDKIRSIKENINDLNPLCNELDLMELYIKEEDETHHKKMEEMNSGESSFLSLCHQISIVRGKGWRVGDNSISMLGHYGYSVSLNMELYKNPDLYNYLHSNFKSQF